MLPNKKKWAYCGLFFQQLNFFPFLGDITFLLLRIYGFEIFGHFCPGSKIKVGSEIQSGTEKFVSHEDDKNSNASENEKHLRILFH